MLELACLAALLAASDAGERQPDEDIVPPPRVRLFHAGSASSRTVCGCLHAVSRLFIPRGMRTELADHGPRGPPAVADPPFLIIHLSNLGAGLPVATAADRSFALC